MKNLQKGFVAPILIAVVALLVIGSGGYYYAKKAGYISDNKPSDIIQLNNSNCTMDAKMCPDGSYVGRSGSKCEFVCPSPVNDKPIINSISPSSGPVGTVIELRGRNLPGFEGDMDATIENSKGETAFLAGLNRSITDPNLIKVKITDKLCTVNTGYSGLDCPSVFKIVPGVYNIFTTPWSVSSNKVQFTVTAN